MKKIDQHCLTLNNGAKLPMIGLGTWKLNKDDAYTSVKQALEIGYRHIDCAWVYANEKYVGQAIKDFLNESKLSREEIFITTKLWNTKHHPQDVQSALAESLANLQLDYVDLYLMHYPMGFARGDEKFPKGEDGKIKPSDVHFIDTWKAMEALPQDKVRAIGVSNFNKQQLQELFKSSTRKPAAIQIELHPYLPQIELVDFCKSNGIAVISYSSLGSTDRSGKPPNEPKLTEDKTVKEIAARHQVDPGRVLLRYHIENGNAVIPKSAKIEHLKNNLQVLNFSLTKEDMEELKKLGRRNHRFLSVEETKHHPFYPFSEQGKATAA